MRKILACDGSLDKSWHRRFAIPHLRWWRVPGGRLDNAGWGCPSVLKGLIGGCPGLACEDGLMDDTVNDVTEPSPRIDLEGDAYQGGLKQLEVCRRVPVARLSFCRDADLNGVSLYCHCGARSLANTGDWQPVAVVDTATGISRPLARTPRTRLATLGWPISCSPARRDRSFDIWP
jgi:hypothetical protein